jgi:probable HAF family extracellular repeat protein
MKTLTLPLALSGLALPAALCAQTYLVTDLGLPGEQESQAMSLNASGTVVGYSLHSTGMTARAWMWTADGGRVELGGFGGLESRAYAVNDAGQIAGYATDAGGVAHGFIYDAENGLAELGAAPVAGDVYPQAINSAGHVAGYISTSGSNLPFVWLGPGNWVLPGTLPGADPPAGAQAAGLNDADQLAGEATWIFGATRAIQSAGDGTKLSPLPLLGGEIAKASAINNLSQIVGEAETINGAQHAFFFDGQKALDLGTLGGADSAAMFINDVGDVAGSSLTSSGAEHAFIWTTGTGMEDLQPRIAPTLGWTLNEARAINEAGLIAGNGTLSGQSRAFLLTPRSGPDTHPPVLTATLSTNLISGTSFSPIYLTVTVWDDVMVEARTLGTGSVRVTGPNGSSTLAPLNNRAPSTNAIQTIATFQINPPEGNWDGADNGAYVISLEPNLVRDIAGNLVPAQTLAAFIVAIQTNATARADGPTPLLPGQAGNFTFTAQSSYPSGSADVFTFAIDWEGDGMAEETFNTVSPLNLSHSFPGAGIYTVRVTATDPHSRSASAALEVMVNPPPGSWTSGPTLGTRYNGAGFYAQGRLYYLGGDPLLPAVEGNSQVNFFDLSTGAWQPAAELDTQRYAMGAGVDSRSRIVVFGAHGDESAAGSGGFTYTATSGEGSHIATRNYSVAGFAWCADPLARLYSIGGGGTTGVERYDGASNAWTALAPLPVPRTGAAAVYDGHGRILVVGGGDAQVFAYAIAEDSWTQLPNAPQTHNGQRAALGGDGLVYVLNDASLLVFNPLNNSWGLGPVPASAHDSLAAGTSGLLYAFGGPAGTMEILDPSTAGVPPFFTSTPTGGTLTGRVNQAWSYQAGAGGLPPPGFYLAGAPAGMVVSADGWLTWTPDAGQQGANVVVLRATNSMGIAQQKFTVNIRPALLNNDATPPSAVGNLIATNITDTTGQLVWSPATDDVGVASYRLYSYRTACVTPRCTVTRVVNVLQAANLTATTLTLTGLTPGGYYKRGVTAVDAAGNESPHTKIAFYTLSSPRLIPGPITAQSLSFAIVGEPWQQRFSVAGNPPPTLSFVSGPPGMTFADNTVAWNPVQGGPGTNVVTFTLRVANSVSNFDQTLPITVYPAGTDLVPPSAVTGVQLTEIGADHVGLRWNAATDNHGIAGYWVTATVHYRSRTCARNCTRSRLVARQFFAGTNTAAAALGGLEPSTQYFLTVQAVDTSGNPGDVTCGNTPGRYCSAVSFTTTPWLSVNLMRTSPGNLLFTWDPLQPVYYRLGDGYTYTLVCNPTLASNAAAWLPAPGFSWPMTNTSVELPAATATNQFYRVKADYITQP